MSLILDALKKMEQDKARRQTKSMELGPAILRERTSASGSRWRTPALLACAVVTTAVSMYLVMNPAPKAPEPAIEPAPVVRTAPAPTAIVPPLPRTRIVSRRNPPLGPKYPPRQLVLPP